MRKYLITTGLLLSMLGPLSLARTAFAQVHDEDEIIVTATRITQGGAQDIDFFRNSIDEGRLPAPASITSEGLLSTHDMLLTRSKPCEQLFCLSVETMEADLLSAPDVDIFMGLGFATNIEAATWERGPTTIMAVADTSGSMGGKPLELAKASMREVLAQLRPSDRMGIAHYGDTTSVVMPVSSVGEKRSDILAAINALESDGGTYMEAGLKLAFDTAMASQKGFDGSTRVILFTDEQPNVGNTDADSFIGMAKAASEKGVGLTTIGVAEHFGADLANQISAARGGNLFFVSSEKEVSDLFGTDFDFLVTEVAHDLKVVVKPKKGIEIAEIFGLPGEEIKRKSNGEMSFTIPSVFLSSKGGGIFMSMKGDVDAAKGLADISLSYIGAIDKKKGSEKLAISGPSDVVSEGLKLGHLLSDEFKVLHNAASAAMFGGDMGKALKLTRAFEDRLLAMDKAPEGEYELVSDMGDILEKKIEGKSVQNARYRDINDISPLVTLSEKQLSSAGANVYGPWKITRVKSTSRSLSGNGSIDLRVGDLLSFDLSEDTYDETETFNAQRIKPRGDEPEFEVESMYVDTKKRTITLYKSDIIFSYRAVGNRLLIMPDHTDLVLTLERPTI